MGTDCKQRKRAAVETKQEDDLVIGRCDSPTMQKVNCMRLTEMISPAIGE